MFQVPCDTGIGIGIGIGMLTRNMRSSTVPTFTIGTRTELLNQYTALLPEAAIADGKPIGALPPPVSDAGPSDLGSTW